MSKPDCSLPVAMFDSGVGGLTVLHECLISLPHEDFLYLGDSAHFPYGSKSQSELRERAVVVAGHLIERGAKMLVIACNSATAAGGEAVRELAGRHGIEVVTVVEPEAEIAAAITSNGKVGVLATPATVESGAYHEALARQGKKLEVTEVPAPDLAPIIQSGFPFDEDVIETVRSYCIPLREAGVDTVVLGCTHYPLVAPMLQRMLGRDVSLVTAGHAIAAAVQRELDSAGLACERDSDHEGDYRFLCTGAVGTFTELGTRFLQLPLTGRVERLNLELDLGYSSGDD